MEKNEKINRIMNYLDNKDIDFNYYDTQCNFDLENKDKSLVTANWNNVPDKMVDYIDSIIDTHWDDEVCRCDSCYGAILTTPCYYGDLPDYVILDSEIICKDCILDDENMQEDIIDKYKNQTNKAIMPWFYDVIEKNGYVCYSPDEYCQIFETGFYAGQDDDPKTIAKDIKKNLPGYDFIFKIDSAGQFDINWSVFIKKTDLYKGIK